jgi:putative sigma-54 modulation protein
MNIIISTRHTSIPDQTKQYATQKAEKLGKFSRLRILEVIMDKEAENYCVEIMVSPEKGGTPMMGTAQSADWFSAIDQASDKVERQLRKLKDKVKSHHVKKQQPVELREELDGHEEEKEHE